MLFKTPDEESKDIKDFSAPIADTETKIYLINILWNAFL